MAKTPYIDDDPFDEPPGKRDEDIDTGPLTREQLQGLARDQIEALRHTARELWRHHRKRDCDALLDQLERWLCN